MWTFLTECHEQKIRYRETFARGKFYVLICCDTGFYDVNFCPLVKSTRYLKLVRIEFNFYLTIESTTFPEIVRL